MPYSSFDYRIQDLCWVQVEFRALFKVLQGYLNVGNYMDNLFPVCFHLSRIHMLCLRLRCLYAPSELSLKVDTKPINKN